MFLAMVYAISVAQAEEGCADPVVLVDLARQALLEARLEDSLALMDRAESALGCSGVPTPDALAGMWLTRGAQLFFGEDEAGARRAFAAANRISPSVWYPELGFQLRSLYEESAEQDHGQGTILVQNLPMDMEGVLNGLGVVFPQDVVAGPHLVQFRDDGDVVRDARVVMVSSGESFSIDAGLLTTGSGGEVSSSSARGRRWGFLVVGGVSALAAGGTYLLSSQQSVPMETAGSLTDLEGALDRQRAYAGATYGLSGLALAGVGLYIAL